MSIAAILDAAWTLASADPGWVTTSTKLLHWADVPASARPALFQAMRSPLIECTQDARKVTLPLAYYVYISHTDPAGPAAQLAERIDVLLAAFTPPPGLDRQTLDGLVHTCEIAGEIETDEGTLGTDAVAIVPARIVVG